MCGRYRIKGEFPALEERYPGIFIPSTATAPRYNIAPTQLAPVVLGGAEVHAEMFRWGLIPSWSKDAKRAGSMINARAETVAEKPSFRSAFKHRRCLVLTNGFFEWQTVGKSKQPWLFTLPEESLMVFAGLWEEWRPSKDEDPVKTFTIITTTATTAGAWIHDRMPVILEPGDWDRWLGEDVSPATLEEFVIKIKDGQAGKEIQQWPVTPKMNKASFDSPEAVLPLEPELL